MQAKNSFDGKIDTTRKKHALVLIDETNVQKFFATSNLSHVKTFLEGMGLVTE